MPLLKDILVRQTAIPLNLEKTLPVGLPKVSQMMSQLAAAIPVNPELPELPVGVEAAPTFPAQFAQVIKGIEDVLPTGVPSLSEGIQTLTMGGYRPVETKEKAPPARRVLGGGYRSI